MTKVKIIWAVTSNQDSKGKDNRNGIRQDVTLTFQNKKRSTNPKNSTFLNYINPAVQHAYVM